MNKQNYPDELVLELMKSISFIEGVIKRIYELQDTAEMYRVLKEEFKKSKRFLFAVLMSTGEVTDVEIVETNISRAQRIVADRIIRVSVKTAKQDPNRPTAWQDTLMTGRSKHYDVEKSIRAFLPRTVAQMAIKTIGQKNMNAIVCPLKRNGKTIGVFFMNSPRLTKFFVHSVENLAWHIMKVLDHIEKTVENKKTEEAIRKSEELYRSLFDLSPDGIITVDMKGMVTSCNVAFTRITGFTKNEIINRYALTLPTMIAQDVMIYSRLFKNLLKGELPKELQFKYKRKDGEVRSGEAFPVMIKEKGKNTGVQIFLKDITERKKAEEEKEKLFIQLIESEKMAGIGTLSAGIAHEFNNMLAIIKGNAEYANSERNMDEIKDSLKVILETSDRAAKIVKDLLSFSRRGEPEKELCDINESIQAVVALTGLQLQKNNIEIIWDKESYYQVEMNKSEIQQVFLNLVTNARDAMLPKGGKLEISAEKSGKWIIVKFRDSGSGIKEGNPDRIFEPFYTTKGPLGGTKGVYGTGLGLSVSYGIMQRHGGTIKVESKKGKGTVLSLFFPSIRAKYSKKDKKKPVKKSTKIKSNSILIIDDEERVCNILEKYLAGKGQKVEYVLNGADGIKRIRKKKYDMVFLDLVMPGKSGLEVLSEIKRDITGTRLIVITGKVLDKKQLRELKKKGVYRVIRKPFNMDEIEELISY